MGGRGSTSRITARQQPVAPQPAPIAPPPIAVVQQPPVVQQQPPTPQNTPVAPQAVTALTQMSDAQLAQLANQAKNINMPNFLSDVSDQTQNFVFAAGLNERPQVLDDAAFTQFMSDNNIPQSKVLTRSVNPITYVNASGTKVKMSADDVIDMLKYSRLNYIGGKVNGQAYGAGTYFDQTGGRNTGYGQRTATAVLNPATAHVITDTQLSTQARQFAQTHPQFARAVGAYNTSFRGNNMSIYALAMGYNVIKDSSSGYHNVIDRSALVYKRSNS